jgi:hypothetical protein
MRLADSSVTPAGLRSVGLLRKSLAGRGCAPVIWWRDRCFDRAAAGLWAGFVATHRFTPWRLTCATAPSRTGSVSVLVAEAQLPTLSHARAANCHTPVKPASSKCAVSCDPSKLAGKLVHSFVPAGAISIDPPATPDSASLVSTTTPVGSAGFSGSKLIDGGDSSICSVTVLVLELCSPCGSTALFQTVHETVLTPSPSTIRPPAG